MKKNNRDRMVEIARTRSRPAFTLGERVRHPTGQVGVIDAVFVDLFAAQDCGIIESAPEWWDGQETTPRTSTREFWYSIITEDAALLGGERDLEPARVEL